MNTELVARDESNHKLIVEFHYKIDRYHQYIDVEFAGEKCRLMQSIEGDAKAKWPPSPPLQDATLETREDFEVVLAVGRSGSAHWSSSFKTARQPLGIEIEHACRLPSKTVPDRLSANYQIATEWRLDTNGLGSPTEAVGTEVALRHIHWPCRIQLATSDELIIEGFSGSQQQNRSPREADAASQPWISVQNMHTSAAARPVTATWGLAIRLVPVATSNPRNR